MNITVNQLEFNVEFEIIKGKHTPDNNPYDAGDDVKITEIEYMGVDVFEIINPSLVERIKDAVRIKYVV